MYYVHLSVSRQGLPPQPYGDHLWFRDDPRLDGFEEDGHEFLERVTVEWDSAIEEEACQQGSRLVPCMGRSRTNRSMFKLVRSQEALQGTDFEFLCSNPYAPFLNWKAYVEARGTL